MTVKRKNYLEFSGKGCSENDGKKEGLLGIFSSKMKTKLRYEATYMNFYTDFSRNSDYCHRAAS